MRPHSLPSRTSDTTSVAVTPMFFRYCRCSGDMLRSQLIDMSSSSPVGGKRRGTSGHRLVVARRRARARGCAGRARARAAECRIPGSAGRGRARAASSFASADHFAVAVGVEAVEHHAVVAARARGRSRTASPASASSVARGAQARDGARQALREVAREAPPLAARSTGSSSRRTASASLRWMSASKPRRTPPRFGVAAERSRRRADRRPARGVHTCAGRSPPRPRSTGRAARSASMPSIVGRVVARLQDPRRRCLEHQQRAMRLDRSRMLDQLAVAIGQVGFAECGRVFSQVAWGAGFEGGVDQRGADNRQPAMLACAGSKSRRRLHASGLADPREDGQLAALRCSTSEVSICICQRIMTLLYSARHGNRHPLAAPAVATRTIGDRTRSSSAAASAGWPPPSVSARAAIASRCWRSSMRPAAAPASTARTASPSTPARRSSPRRSCSRSCGSCAASSWPTTSTCGRSTPFYRIRFDDGAHVRLLRRSGGDARRGRAALARRRRRLRALHARERGDLSGRLRAARPRAVRLVDRHGCGSLPDLIRLQSYRTRLRPGRRSYVRDPRLRVVLSFHPLLVGGNPFTATSIYCLIAFLERRWGVHFAMGGTGRLVDGLVELIEGRAARSAATPRSREIVVERRRGHRRAAGDRRDDRRRHRGVERRLRLDLPAPAAGPSARSAGPTASIERARYSMSLFVWYFGTDRQYPDVAAPHHPARARATASCSTDIFERKVLADDFSLYLHRPDRDRSVAGAAGLRRVLRAVAGAASRGRHRLERRRPKPYRQRDRAATLETRCCPASRRRSSPRAC